MSRGRPLALVVDDEEDLCDVVGLILEGEGWEVQIAYDGCAALERYAARRPDLIMLDMRMPRLDGRGFYAAISARPERVPPIVVMTAAADVAESAAAVGATAWLPKPFDVDAMVATARRLAPPADASSTMPRSGE